MLEHGILFPPQKDIIKIEDQTAITVAKKVFELGLARVEKSTDISVWMRPLLYRTEYVHEKR